MNWNQIFQNIGIPAIVSAIVSGGIAFLAYRSQKKIDYAYDYKKYILEKRKSAYDEIEKLINEAGPYSLLIDNVTEIHTFILEGVGFALKTFNDNLASVLTNNWFWLSRNFRKELRQFNLLTLKMLQEINQANTTGALIPNGQI